MRSFRDTRNYKTGAAQTVPDGTQYTRGVGTGNPYAQEKVPGGQPIEVDYTLTLETQKYGKLLREFGLKADCIFTMEIIKANKGRPFFDGTEDIWNGEPRTLDRFD